MLRMTHKQKKHDCPACNGSGRVCHVTCDFCDGEGKVTDEQLAQWRKTVCKPYPCEGSKR